MAEKPLTRFVELDPQNSDAHFELAKVSFALNKFLEAETHARKSVELKETNAGVHVVLGYALLRQKKAIRSETSVRAVPVAGLKKRYGHRCQERNRPDRPAGEQIAFGSRPVVRRAPPAILRWAGTRP